MVSPVPTQPYEAEIRFGVVMYGGVSLAIYIYGVTSEMYALARATPLEDCSAGPADPDGTGVLYQRLSLLASDAGLRQRYADCINARAHDDKSDLWSPAFEGGERTRFVIDVIAGTSAGGINGIFLAKALAKAQPFSVLGDLWVNDGDIAALLNDGEAYKGLPKGLWKPDGPPASLLSSDRMYMKLLSAFNQMDPKADDAALVSPLVDELDLYVTTTDIAGAPVALRLFDKVVYERRHKQRFHFSYPSQVGDTSDPANAGQDFAAANHAFLAFAARCTSSFPFAFEPMTLQRVTRLLPDIDAQQLLQWNAYFDTLPPEALRGQRHLERPFGDGGYLDNKPFSYVVETLSQRFGDAPAQRKLIYVEPDPEPLDPVQDTRTTQPNAVSNALAALVEIPLYETIREDLQAILQRNRRIERVERIVRMAEEDTEARQDGFSRVRCENGKVPEWSKLTLERMVAYYGEGFLPYRRLRVYAVTDWLAQQVAGAFGVDFESDSGYALRAVVRAWREARFEDNPPTGGLLRSVNAFLDEHDLDYRLRRLAFLLRRIDQLMRLLRAAGQPAGAATRSDLEQLIAKKMARVFGALDPLVQTQLAPPLLAMLRALKLQLRRIYRELLATRRRWARGLAISAAVQPDIELRRELADVLTMLIGPTQPKHSTPPTLRNMAGETVAMPAPGGWLQSRSSAHTEQDSVMARVQAWLKDSAGRPPLVLWQGLDDALAATQLNNNAGAAGSVAKLLHENWDLLGQPRLQARVVQKLVPAGTELPTCEAHLIFDAVTTAPDGRAIADTPEGEAACHLRRLLGEYYLSFDAFDQTRFTLYYDTATGEPATVDVVRVSPVDANSLRAYDPARSKLAGVKVAHFGAFLDAHWRRNDIMWGRLDGAERLIQTVLPGEDAATQTVRDELIRLAHGRILTQTLKRESANALTGQLVAALDEVGGGGGVQDRLGVLLEELNLRPGPARQRLADVLAALLSPEQLRDYARTQPTFDPKPPAAPTLRSAARAVTITGRVLEGISQAEAGAATPAVRWIARAGLLLQGAVALSIPGGLGERWWSAAVKVLYGLEVLLFVLSFLVGGTDLRWAATTAWLGTVALHVLTLVLRDHFRGRGWAVGLAVGGGVLLCLAGIVIGIVALLTWGPAALCGTITHPPLSWLAAPCGWLR